MTVPLYTSGAIDSRQRESVAKKSQAEQDLDVAQRDMRLQVQDAFLSVKTGVSRVGALDQSVLSAQTALEAATLGRDLGTRTELDVLDAQQRVFAAPSTWRRRATTTCSAASDSLRRPASCRRAICIR